MRKKGFLRLLSAVLCMILVLDTLSAVAFATTTDVTQPSDEWTDIAEDETEWDVDEWEDVVEDENEWEETAPSVAIISGQGNETDTETVSEGPVSALVDESTTGKDTEVMTSENVVTAMEELADEGYGETIIRSKRQAGSASENSYVVSKANTDGTFTDISTYASFDEAKSAMNDAAASAGSEPDQSSYVVRYNERVVAMTDGIAIVTSTSGGTLTFSNTYGGRGCYVTNNSVLFYYDTESLNEIKVGISGITNYTSYENLMLVPLPFTSGYADSDFNTYEMGYYQKNSAGEMVHVITTFTDEDKTTHYESGEGTEKASIAIDKAPSFMEEGKKYYSMDGVNFYNDLQLTSEAGTYYNYYQYLSYHTETSYTAEELNEAVSLMTSDPDSVLLDAGEDFIAAQNNYGINALMELAFACLESSYGTSTYAKERNNLFGINAGDANPDDASYYSSVSSCISYHAEIVLKQGYFDALGDARYMGTNTGKKSVGVNVAYASDPYHGEKIASVAYRLDKALGGNDYGRYTIGISGTSTPVYTSTAASTILYKLMNNQTNTDLSGLPVVVLSESGDYSKVQSDMPIVDGAADCKGTYSFDHIGYVKSSEISVVQEAVISEEPEPEPTVDAPTSPKAEASSTSSIKVSWTASSDADGYEVWYATSSGGTYTKLTDTTAASYTHTGLAASTAYYYKVRAYKTVNGEKYYSDDTSVVTATTNAITVNAPTSPKAEASSTSSIKVSWTKSTDADGYEVWYATFSGGTYTKLTDTTAASYTHTGLAASTAYYYKVRAYKTVNGEKYYSDDTSVVTATTNAITVNAPTNPEAKASSTTKINVSWTKSSDADGYRVYYATSENGTYTRLTDTTSTSYTHSGLTAAKAYYYKVRAYKKVDGTTYFSSYTSVVLAVTNPKQVTGVTVSNSSATSVKISWSKVSSVTDYQIFRSTKKDSGFTRIASVSAESTSYLNSSLTAGTTYYYKVIAYKTVGGVTSFGAYSSVKSIKVKPPQTTGLTLKNSTPTSIKVSWNKVSGASGYRVYRSTKKSSGYSLVKTVTSGSTTSWTNSSLKTNTTYYYKVRAYKTSSGTKVFGAYTSVKSLKAKPAQTTGLTLKNSTPTSIRVSWNKVSGASGYRVYRSTKKSSGYSLVKTVSSGSTTSWTNSSLKTGTTYYYKVRAYKTSGGTKVFGSYSSVKSLKAKPATPSGVKVTSASSTKAKVSWNKVSGASGYEVYRSTSKSSGYKKVKTTSSASWTNSGLTKGRTYYYKVRAYKTVNGKKVYSAYSSVKSIKK